MDGGCCGAEGVGCCGGFSFLWGAVDTSGVFISVLGWEEMMGGGGWCKMEVTGDCS